MTKADVLAFIARGQDVADLDLVARDDHSVDQQFDQLPLPVERRRLEPGGDPPAERFERRRHAHDLVEAFRFPGEPGLLLGQGLLPRLQFPAPAAILFQWDDAAEVGLGQPIELARQRRLPLPQPLPSRLEFLRVPAPGGRPTERPARRGRISQQLA
ncbi:hypothetical protein [Paludisphaera mucosa]|uniref:Uncharacterized protein n=1 Tax=Paludisphaera mucosa TaxID=3030827 RepID=A0ABT6FLG0_9BACT|nr:hypothetical protein [Paludisphaera mucosa]MDG3008407.1 hypothetical protein [Paludisphaera mucosa]